MFGTDGFNFDSDFFTIDDIDAYRFNHETLPRYMSPKDPEPILRPSWNLPPTRRSFKGDRSCIVSGCLDSTEYELCFKRDEGMLMVGEKRLFSDKTR